MGSRTRREHSGAGRNVSAVVFVTAALVLLGHCGARSDLGAPASSEDARATVPCIAGDIPLTKAEPTILFVLDRSRSMAQSIGRGTGDSRWGTLTKALAESLSGVDGAMRVGALFYPALGASTQQCAVPPTVDVPPGTNQTARVLEAMRATNPNGPTPTATALEVAARSLLNVRAAAPARALVLATDGAPDCNAALDGRSCRCSAPGTCGTAIRCLDDVRTVERIAGYAARGLPTYVIGIGEATFGDVLDRMAVAGGRARAGSPKYFPAGSASELTAALVAIRERIGSCTFLTSSVPTSQGTITLSQGGRTIPEGPTDASGWTWSDKGNGEIVFGGDACAKVSTGSASSVIAHVTCGEGDGGADADARGR